MSIELDQVTQDFPGRTGVRVRAVDDVSLTLESEPASIVSLVGASGSGKSTIARIILGLQRPTAGRVTYGGKRLDRLSRRERDTCRRDVQPVFQDPYSIFITHDLSTVAYVGGQMMTLYRGKVVETGAVADVMTNPSHPYTELLLASVPPPDPDKRWTDRITLDDGY